MERGGAVRSQPVSRRMLAAMPQLHLIIGNLVVRYLAGDIYLLCSSIGGGLGPPYSSSVRSNTLPCGDNCAIHQEDQARAGTGRQSPP